jgi:excisionase family DNA binding protein
MNQHPLLVVEEVARLLQCSRRTVHELTRTAAIPHFKPPRCRRCYFRLDWLQAWLEGASLEVEYLSDGGRVVRPASQAA